MKDESLIPHELLAQVIEYAQDGIVIAEKEGDDHILIYVNHGFEQLTGYQRDEILYQDCRFLQGSERDQPGLKKIREALQKGQACREIVRNYRKDGRPFWNELSITPFFNDADELMYYIGVQKDVTELVELRAQEQNSLTENK